MTTLSALRATRLLKSKNLYLLLAIFVVWEACVRLFQIRAFLLPPPSTVLYELYRYPQYFFKETAVTLWTTLLGLGVATTLGVAMGVAINYYRILEETVYRLLVAFNAVPKVALAPLFVIWFGTGMESKIAISAMISIFPIVISTVMGLKSIDPEIINMAFAGHASKLKTLYKIRLPNALPEILSGIKVASSFALVGAIVAEFVAGASGLGHVILVAQGQFDTARVFAALVLLGVLGFAIFFAIEMVEKMCLSWHVSQRGSSAFEVAVVRA